MATTRQLTIEELERDGPPEGRWELIDGELVEMTPSGSGASSVATTFTLFLGNHVRPRKLGKIYGADGGFVVFAGRQIVRVPDAAFVRAERLPSEEEQEKFLRLAPDLVVEVVSPYDRAVEVLDKAMMWLQAGVRLVWVADRRLGTVTVYAPDSSARVLRHGEELDGGDVLPGFKVAVAELFS